MCSVCNVCNNSEWHFSLETQVLRCGYRSIAVRVPCGRAALFTADKDPPPTITENCVNRYEKNKNKKTKQVSKY